MQLILTEYVTLFYYVLKSIIYHNHGKQNQNKLGIDSYNN